MSAAHFAERLHRLRDFLRTRPAGFPFEDADAIATGIDRFFDRRCTLDEALGIHLDGGERHPGTSQALAARDDALRSAAGKICRGSGSSAAIIAERLQVYERTAWKRERTQDVCPPQRVGRIEGDFWAALKAWPHVLGERQLRNILREQKK